MRWLAPLAFLALSACDDGGSESMDMGADMPDAAPPTCEPAQAITDDCPEGATAQAPVYVLSTLAFAQLDPETNRVQGFDLDARISEPGDAETCRHGDFEAPDGRGGIDNQLASLWPAIEAVTGDAVDGLIQGTINNGDLLIGLGVNLDGDRAEVGLRTLAGNPLIGTNARLLSNQTFTHDDDAAIALATGSKDGEWIEVGPFEVTLPLVILSFEVDLQLTQAFIRFRVLEDGHIEGTLGGGLSVEEFMEGVDGADLPSSLKSFVRTTLQSRADLEQNAEGQCQRLSAGLVFEGVPAWVSPW
jgi:hypothetical protein